MLIVIAQVLALLYLIEDEVLSGRSVKCARQCDRFVKLYAVLPSPTPAIRLYSIPFRVHAVSITRDIKLQ